MPHLQIQYSPGLETLVDLQDLCDQLNDVMVGTGVFPLAGVRVRAFRADVVSIADKHPSNAFCAMQVYMGAGRTLDQKQAAGQAINDCAVAFFRSLLSQPHFMLSLDIFENDPALSWKINPIHARLAQKD